MQNSGKPTDDVRPSGEEGMSRAEPQASTGPEPARTATVAVDTGGTFTDLVIFVDGEVRTLKVPSTPDDPSRAILDGLRQAVGDDCTFTLRHGSTVATNALLERRVGRVVLITNEGFTDVLEIGRQNRPDLYALSGQRAAPLVTAEDRWGIQGRIDADGSEHAPLDRDELQLLRQRLAATDADAVAICLLHSYAEPRHEAEVAAALDTTLPISQSAQLLPEYREYERTSTTVVNAAVAPVMARYLKRLGTRSGAGRVAIMGSNGGMIPIERAMREPAHTVLSGPAGGVVGALAWARRAGIERIATFDMGGTSTDVAFCPGRPLHTREFEIGGHPVALPVIDVHTVGAGGGSIATVDAGGALQVGPASAGARPGPICYGRGGHEVTVTDAHVWLGRLPIDAFRTEGAELRRAAIQAPLRQLAERIGRSLEDTADGVLAVADTAMERALRVISVERGHDTADLTLVAFGGAGALHAAELARRLGMPRVLVPPSPGLLSAWGILGAPMTRERSRSVLVNSHRADAVQQVDDVLNELERSARSDLEAEGVALELIASERRIDARYRGQSFELSIAARTADEALQAFHQAHEQRYGYRRDEAAVEIVTCRAAASAPGIELPSVPPPRAAEPAAHFVDVVYEGRVVSARRIERAQWPGGCEVAGPALITDYSATLWIPPEWRGHVDEHGIVHLLQL